jgi:hypothetical protein
MVSNKIESKRFGWHAGDVHAKDIICNGVFSLPVQAFTATASVQAVSGLITLNHAATPILLDIPAPKRPGDLLIITSISAATHVCTSHDGSTFNAAGNNTATFDASGDLIMLMAVSTTQWLPIYNNSVVLSTV